MEQRPGQDRPQPTEEEQTRIAVDSFVTRTHSLFGEHDTGVYVQWKDQMDRFYGHEELVQVTKDEGYRGIPGIREKLEAAYRTGGMLRLEVAFMEQALMHTKLKHMERLSRIAFQRILDHE